MNVQMNESENKVNSSRYFRTLILILAPLIIACLYIIGVQIHSLSRYDQAFFTPEYQDRYHSPGTVAQAMEIALREGDMLLYAELTGLNRNHRSQEPLPSLALSDTLNADQDGYFRFLYFELDTMRRNTQYVKEVDGRWVAVPQDAYFYFDSGKWTNVFMPLAIGWWVLLITIAIIKAYTRWASRTQTAFGW